MWIDQYSQSGGTVKPVKEKESPREALEARLRAAPPLTPPMSSPGCALFAFLICVFLLLLWPGDDDDGTVCLLDFFEWVPQLPLPLSLLLLLQREMLGPCGDLKPTVSFSGSCSDLALIKLDEVGISILKSIKMLLQAE